MNFQIDKRIFQKYKVKLAYLFGSQAKGISGAESDFDLAVLFKEKPPDPLALKEITFLSLELGKFFPAEVDIVSLNDAPPLLKYEVISARKALYCEKEKERINFEVSVLKEYIDGQFTRDIYFQALVDRIDKGVL